MGWHARGSIGAMTREMASMGVFMLDQSFASIVCINRLYCVKARFPMDALRCQKRGARSGRNSRERPVY